MTVPGPRIGFVLGGAQKGGTTALASFLARHPDLALPAGKEAHVFDAPDFDDAWGRGEVEARYLAHFGGGFDARLHGDATPIYMLHPRLVQRIRRYNPGMRWIVILRHPVDRALSQYHMERARGDEHLPLWLALLAERHRLRGRGDDLSARSPLRHHAYRLRGDYARQLDALYAAFPAEQVLVLRNDELEQDPAGVTARACSFLGLDPGRAPAGGDFGRVFAGRYARWPARSWRHRLLCWWWRRELREQARRYGLEWGGA